MPALHRPILTATNQVVGLLERRANEYFLFHGTNVQTAETLKHTGFDARVSSVSAPPVYLCMSASLPVQPGTH